MAPGHGELQLTERAPVVIEAEAHAAPRALELHHAVGGVGGGAIGDGVVLPREGSGAGIVGAGDAQPASVGKKGPEGGDHAVDAAVVLDVIGLDAGDNHRLGAELQEGAVALVRFDDEPVARVPGGAGADLVQLAADDERGPEPGLQKHEGEHG